MCAKKQFLHAILLFFNVSFHQKQCGVNIKDFTLMIYVRRGKEKHNMKLVFCRLCITTLSVYN